MLSVYLVVNWKCNVSFEGFFVMGFEREVLFIVYY